MIFLKETLKEIGYRNTYDLEIDHKDHNFLIGDGYPIVTSNSHSVSYAYNAFMCAYLAFYYPLQWYTAVLRHEDPIEFVPIVKEQIKQLQYNITIKPPKLNYTVAIPTIVNNDIVLGISQIKGIGPKAAEELKHIRTNYKSFNEFIQSDKYSKRIVNKGVINKLIQIGFFDDVENGINKIQIRRNLLIQYNKKKMKKKDAEKITKNNYLQIIFNYSGDEKLFYYQSELQMLGVAVSEFPYIKLVNRIHSFMKYDNKKYYYNHTEPLMQIISSIEGIKIKKTKTKKTYVSLNMRTIDGKIIWVNVFDRSIKEMYKKWKIDLMQGKQYKNNWFLFYYSENGNWKNFINLVPLKFFIKNNSSIINIKE